MKDWRCESYLHFTWIHIFMVDSRPHSVLFLPDAGEPWILSVCVYLNLSEFIERWVVTKINATTIGKVNFDRWTIREQIGGENKSWIPTRIISHICHQNLTYLYHLSRFRILSNPRMHPRIEWDQTNCANKQLVSKAPALKDDECGMVEHRSRGTLPAQPLNCLAKVTAFRSWSISSNGFECIHLVGESIETSFVECVSVLHTLNAFINFEFVLEMVSSHASRPFIRSSTYLRPSHLPLQFVIRIY